MRRLDELDHGEQAKVERIDGDGDLAQRLMAMAVLPGVSVEIVCVAPLGDPITVQIGASQLSLRRRDAANVVVS